MKETTVMFLVIMFFISAFSTGCNNESKNIEERPVIKVIPWNNTPEHFFIKGDYINRDCDMMNDGCAELSSKIRQDYFMHRSNKWVTNYKYAFIILKDTYSFKRVAYLKSHPTDAVDKAVIFSDNPPDPKLFRITSE